MSLVGDVRLEDVYPPRRMLGFNDRKWRVELHGLG